MKLKLETQDNVTILAVSETLTAADLAILKAGLKKLFNSGKTTVLVDLMAVNEASIRDPGVFNELSGLLGWGDGLEGPEHRLFLVSSVVTLGGAPNRAEGIAILKTNLPKLLAKESRLKLVLRELEPQKTAAEKSLAASTQGGTDIITLRQENTTLKSRVARLEDLVREYHADRAEPVAAAADLRTKTEFLTKILLTALQKEGILQDK